VGSPGQVSQPPAFEQLSAGASKPGTGTAGKSNRLVLPGCKGRHVESNLSLAANSGGKILSPVDYYD